MKSFRIKNIKSFLDSGTIEIAPITIFVGQNSCGKSSLLRYPVLLAQSVMAASLTPIVFNGKYVDYGFFEDVVHNQNGDEIAYEFSYDVDINDDDDFRYIQFHKAKDAYGNNNDKCIKTVKMSFTVVKNEKNILVKSASMYIDKKCIVTFWGETKETETAVSLYYLLLGDRFKKVKYDFKLENISFKDGGFPFYDQADLFASIYQTVHGRKNASSRDKQLLSNEYNRLFLNANPYGNKLLSETDNNIIQIKASFDRISTIMSHVYVFFQEESFMLNYIGPFREAPSRIYRDSESTVTVRGVGTHGENVSAILSRNYKKKKSLLNRVSKWIEPTLGYKLTLSDMKNGFFQMKLIDKNGIQSDISDVGFGISQVLPIITQVIYNTSMSVTKHEERYKTSLYIEQPELHLHPAAQAKLADLFAECVVGEYNPNTIVIETHSEHLIRRLQVLVSSLDCPLTSEMIRIYYIDKNQRGNATIKQMKMKENGKFEDNWPSGFFDQAYNLTMDLLRNTSNRL